MSLLDKIQALIDEEVKIQINKYARTISQRHDISLQLLLQDLGNFTSSASEEEPKKKGQCLGVTKRKTQCKISGKNEGYCLQHHSQKPIKKVCSTQSLTASTEDQHVGHTLQDSLFLSGCPACERHQPKQKPKKLLIDI